ncbi:WLM-domain-containing protein [Lentithecium fluviatile CBS 122367]|uniref:WLM-domain-containing protein n=1 Tax=Lentithecium fluviatile CBS 122367 TaxID=1168545 RepID=A0A6G1IW82_9PLEO|nr:WLM-domain-containing protein [Lentithecium fluviatile CBS 122367]
MREIDAHFDAYEHLKHLPREGEALHMLRKAASMVKPMMRKRGWKVGTLAEFLPDEPQLLGLNINRTERILIRLRYHHDSRQFLSMEQVTDTLLHELSHIVWGPHDNNFHNLWNELRDEHQSLIAKGYTGEGFLTQGKKLGGKRVPLDEMRRQARIAAEKRKASTNQNEGGRRLGGQPIAKGIDMRKVIADAAKRRNSITEGCASGSAQAPKLIDQQAGAGFRTKAEETDANDLAIAQALQELMEEEEMLKLEELCAPNGGGGLAWDPVNGLQFDNDPPSRTSTPGVMPSSSRTPPPNTRQRPLSRLVTEDANNRSKPKSTVTPRPPSRIVSAEEASRRNKTLPPSPPPESHPQPAVPTAPTNPDEWACPQCTLHNPLEFLSCEACGLEQPPQPIPPNQRYGPQNHPASLPKPPPAADLRGKGVTPFEPAKGRIGWNCLHCGTFIESQWWTCTLCGTMKLES